MDLLVMTVQEIQEALAAGELTSYELVKFYFERIHRIDRGEKGLNSILSLNPEAVFIARAMDRERAAGKVRGPLHGIPVLLKDNFNTHDQMVTSAGSLALADNYAPYDATVVRKLREAGLVILGKTNMTEFANFMATDMPNGYSSRGGKVVHAYNAGADTSGSSSGSAVAMAANLAPLALGTETVGSIIWPANNNAIVGIKPSRGLVSRHGIVPICTAQDTAGPMTRFVADAAALLNVMVGEDANDPATWCQDAHIPEDYTAALTLDGIRGKRIGFDRQHFHQLSDEEKAIGERHRQLLVDEGAEVIDINLPAPSGNYANMFYEFKNSLNHYLSTCSPALRCRTLKDIIAFNKAHPERCLKYGQDVLERAESLSGTLTEAEYLEQRFAEIERYGSEGISAILREFDLDYIVQIGVSVHAPISGYPSISVPAGYDSGKSPIGLSFIGELYDDFELIRAAYTFEQKTKARELPPFDLNYNRP